MSPSEIRLAFEGILLCPIPFAWLPFDYEKYWFLYSCGIWIATNMRKRILAQDEEASAKSRRSFIPYLYGASIFNLKFPKYYSWVSQRSDLMALKRELWTVGRLSSSQDFHGSESSDRLPGFRAVDSVQNGSSSLWGSPSGIEMSKARAVGIEVSGIEMSLSLFSDGVDGWVGCVMDGVFQQPRAFENDPVWSASDLLYCIFMRMKM